MKVAALTDKGLKQEEVAAGADGPSEKADGRRSKASKETDTRTMSLDSKSTMMTQSFAILAEKNKFIIKNVIKPEKEANRKAF
jgi:hypothetical protein